MDLKGKAALVVLRGIIWSMAGGLFGAVFLGVLGHLEAIGRGVWQIPVAAAVAGAFVGAFYSAKRVALVGASVGSFASIGFLMAAAAPPRTGLPVLLVSALAGLLVGGLASSMYERREAALLVAVAGLVAGAVAGLCAVGLGALGVPVDRPFVQTLILVPITGTLFVAATLSPTTDLKVPLPQWLSVGIVASGIAGLVGLGLWAFSATLGAEVDPKLAERINATLGLVPGAAGGGMVGGAIGGMLLQLLTLRWLEATAGSRGPQAASGGPPAPAPTEHRGAASVAWDAGAPRRRAERPRTGHIARLSRLPLGQGPEPLEGESNPR
jgi:hypothetical protein